MALIISEEAEVILGLKLLLGAGLFLFLLFEFLFLTEFFLFLRDQFERLLVHVRLVPELTFGLFLEVFQVFFLRFGEFVESSVAGFFALVIAELGLVVDDGLEGQSRFVRLFDGLLFLENFLLLFEVLAKFEESVLDLSRILVFAGDLLRFFVYFWLECSIFVIDLTADFLVDVLVEAFLPACDWAVIVVSDEVARYQIMLRLQREGF